MSSAILPIADTDMLHIFLTQVSEDSATSFVVMQVDGGLGRWLTGTTTFTGDLIGRNGGGMAVRVQHG